MSSRSADADAPDLAALVLAARDGDDQAWSALVDQFARLVFAVCRGFRLGDADAGDVSQTVWLRLAENLARIEQPERVGAWLVTTARRECLALVRARARFEPLSEHADSWASTGPAPSEVVERHETINEVAAAFALLSQRCRELLRRVIAGREESYQDIAAALSMPIGSIGPTRARCLQQLKRFLMEGAYAH